MNNQPSLPDRPARHYALGFFLAVLVLVIAACGSPGRSDSEGASVDDAIVEPTMSATTPIEPTTTPEATATTEPSPTPTSQPEPTAAPQPDPIVLSEPRSELHADRLGISDDEARVAGRLLDGPGFADAYVNGTMETSNLVEAARMLSDETCALVSDFPAGQVDQVVALATENESIMTFFGTADNYFAFFVEALRWRCPEEAVRIGVGAG